MAGAPQGSARSIRLSVRGLGLLSLGTVSVAAAYLAGLPELLYVGGLCLILPLAAILAMTFRRLELEVFRAFTPAVAAVGQPTVVELLVANRSGAPTPRLSWSDRAPWGLRSGDARGELPPLRARTGSAPGAARYLITPPRRGLFEVGPLRVAVGDPFGLCRAEVSVGGVTRVLVTPVVERIPPTALSAVSSDGRRNARQRPLGGQDDLSTREYRTGDALRRVHWRATARYGELMVRQEESLSHSEVRLILDTRRSGYRDLSKSADRPESATFERAVSLITSAALHFSKLGYTVDLVELGPGRLATVTPVASFVRSAALLELSTSPAELPRRAAAHGAVFAVVASADSRTVELLAALRVGCHPTVAFVIGADNTVTIEARARLIAAGWDCVAVPPGMTTDHLWHTAAERYRASNVS